ncbi:hypothetical protein CNR22_12885 [Sphingobacteriaceae bacterium]|nr:hypothetical protein CNR22_12885 [Sphingobacteriaceae bacterium]
MKKITPLKKFAAVLCLLLSAAATEAQVIYGTVNNNQLISFNAASPAAISSSLAITGISAGQTIEGLDFRPNTGQLYAFGYDKATTMYQLYTLNLTTGAATSLNTASTIALGSGPIGFDFNPTVDRIRVTSANGANFRLHPVTGAIAFTDGNLAFAAGDVNVGASPKIVSGGYTNSYIGASTTALYNYDNLLNIITLQNPPNNGSLTTVGSTGLTTNTVNPLVDMDIYYDNATLSNKAYLVANSQASPSTDELYSINLTTGQAVLIGAIGETNPVSNIAVLINRTLPNVMGEIAWALSGTNLISFDTQNPNFIRNIYAVTGVTAGQTLVGMDFRPATGVLYALGYNSITNEGQLYTLSLSSGAASAVNTSPIAITLGSVSVGFDFNPTVDKIRVVSNNDMNYRLDPLSGTISATDSNLSFASTDVNAAANPNAGTVAYSNSFNTSTATVLYNYDETLNIFTTQSPPNNGTLNTIGSSGITVNSVDPSVDMDIYYDIFSSTNRAYLAANINMETNDNFYSINLTSGAASLIGRIGFGVPVRDIAVHMPTLITGISDYKKNSEKSLATVFPNPLSETSIIRVYNNSDVEITILDVSGRVISVNPLNGGNSSDLVWNTSGLEKGIYFVRLTTRSGEQQLIKVIK